MIPPPSDAEPAAKRQQTERVDRGPHSLQQGTDQHMADGDADPNAALLGGSNSSIHFTEAEDTLNAVTPRTSPLLLPAPDYAHRAASSPLNHAISSTAESGGATEQDVAARRLAHLQQLHKLYKVESWTLMEELRTQHGLYTSKSRGGDDKQPGVELPSGEEDSSVPEVVSVRNHYRLQGQAGLPLIRKHGAVSSSTSSKEPVEAHSRKGDSKGLAPESRTGNRKMQDRAVEEGALQATVLSALTPQQQEQQQQQRVDGVSAGGSAAEIALAAVDAIVSDDVVIEDKFVSSAAKNTALALGNNVRGYGSEEEPATFSDVERDISDVPLVSAMQSKETIMQWYREFEGRLEDVGRLEASASAASSRDLSTDNAMALLVGRRNRFLIKRPLIMIGRAHARGGEEVDVDLAEEGDASGVSRQHAKLELKCDGNFYLRNKGQKPVLVNNVPVKKGQCLWVPHLSLIDVSGISLLFMINHDAVRRIVARSKKIANGFFPSTTASQHSNGNETTVV